MMHRAGPFHAHILADRATDRQRPVAARPVACRLMQPGQRVVLSVGPSTGLKIFMTFVALFFVGGSFVFMAVAAGIGGAISWFASAGEQSGVFGDGSQTPPFFSAAAGLLALCGIPFVLFGVYFVL